MSSVDLMPISSLGLGRWMTILLRQLRPWRAVIAVALAVVVLMPGSLGETTRQLLIDAYLQVSVFVAAALMLFYGAEHLLNFKIANALRNSRYAQVPLAALLGVTPGCGGAVVVVAAFASGHASFGAVVAALTATMGDAAFLLIATRPDAAAVLLPLTFCIGIVSGWLVDAALPALSGSARRLRRDMPQLIGTTRWRDITYGAIAIPGVICGILLLFGMPGLSTTDSVIGWLALIGMAISIVIWTISPLKTMANSDDSPMTRMAEETSFISVWVIAAFLGYEYLALYGGLDLEAAFAVAAPYLPLIAIIIGLIPGCGPQVVVTTLYINGIIPFAALMGNAISNDGDALFPAIAVEPRAALLATLYSAVPALIVAYLFYVMFPGFMN